jgi:hypothetical protein
LHAAEALGIVIAQTAHYQPTQYPKSNWLELLVDIRISSMQHFFYQDSESVSKKEASKIIPWICSFHHNTHAISASIWDQFPLPH